MHEEDRELRDQLLGSLRAQERTHITATIGENTLVLLGDVKGRLIGPQEPPPVLTLWSATDSVQQAIEQVRAHASHHGDYPRFWVCLSSGTCGWLESDPADGIDFSELEAGGNTDLPLDIEGRRMVDVIWVWAWEIYWRDAPH